MMKVAWQRVRRLSLLLLLGAGLACGGRAVSAADGAGEQQGDGGRAEGARGLGDGSRAGGLCSGGDKLIFNGQRSPQDHVEATAGTHPTKPASGALRVTLSQGQMGIDWTWSGVFVWLTTPAPLKPTSAPLRRDLGALPPGWTLGASQFAGSCAWLKGKRQCKSAASPIVTSTDQLQGQLEIVGGKKVTLCVSVTRGPGQAPVLEAYAREVAVSWQ